MDRRKIALLLTIHAIIAAGARRPGLISAGTSTKRKSFRVHADTIAEAVVSDRAAGSVFTRGCILARYIARANSAIREVAGLRRGKRYKDQEKSYLVALRLGPRLWT